MKQKRRDSAAFCLLPRVLPAVDDICLIGANLTAAHKETLTIAAGLTRIMR